MDDVLQALADPVRRSILTMLCGAPLRAGRIAEAFEISRPAVSRHLRVLREAGLVEDAADGRERVYRLTPSPLEQVQSFVAGLRSPPAAAASEWERRFMALETEVYRVRARKQTERPAITQPRKRRSA
jgi:DNA-binding transcriptional ArsR family regulator